jgi:hypothetical protein
MKELERNITAVFEDFRPLKVGDDEVRRGDKVDLPTLHPLHLFDPYTHF